MATQRRDLRTGRTFWMSRPMPRVAASPLARDIATDVLVVGAGISGALTAEALASDGREVVVVDRRGPVRGSTPASTALVEFEIDTPLVKLARKIGLGNAERAWRRSRLAIDALAERTRALGIDCDLGRRDNLYLAGDMLDAEGLAAECEARRAAGIETRLLSRKALKEEFGIAREAALLAYDDIVLDPRRLTAGYLRAAIDNGARIHAPVDIAEINVTRRGVAAITRAGPTIRCNSLVLATGYEIADIVPKRGHSVASTYAIATRPQPRKLWPGECLIWEASETYLYLRTTPDGRVICGGEDEDFSDEEARDALIPEKVDAIQRKLGKLLPQIDTTPDYAWAGAFGVSDTGLPSIGEVPGKKNVWAVLGFGGNGITYSRIAADIIRTAFAGKADPDADLYAFRRRRATR
jgi:glycine/D-amino acid oxidase-like deaminating enzyme